MTEITPLELKLLVAFKDALDRDITYSQRSLIILDRLTHANASISRAIQTWIPPNLGAADEMLKLAEESDALRDDIQECYTLKKGNWDETIGILEKLRVFNQPNENKS